MSIELKEAAYSYQLPDGREIKALSPITLTVRPGEFLAVVGANGSGKSTLAKLLNGLLQPTGGEVLLDDRPISEAGRAVLARRRVGLLFQNPDNQIVATIVEDDVAFGPENLGLPSEEIRRRVDDSLHSVGMSAFAASDPFHLSAGQKQRVAVAGLLAMRPTYMVLDEPTSMLDPAGRREVLSVIEGWRRGGNIGVVYITHNIEEAAQSDRVVVLKEGQVFAQGETRGILSDSALMAAAGLSTTTANLLARRLVDRGLTISTSVLTIEELAHEICSST